MSMSNKSKRLSAGSTPIVANASSLDIDKNIEENSPIVSTKRKLSFSEDTDSDDEIIFTKQANKRKKMSSKEEIKLWFREEIGNKLDKLELLATSEQVDLLRADITKNTAQTEANTLEINRLSRQVASTSHDVESDRRSSVSYTHLTLPTIYSV